MAHMELIGKVVVVGDELRPSYLKMVDTHNSGWELTVPIKFYDEVGVGDEVKVLSHLTDFEIENRVHIGFEQIGLEFIRKAPQTEATIQW